MMCEMCGKDAPLFQTEVEGIKLNLCKGCSRHGKVIKSIHIPSGNELKRKAKEREQKAQEPPQFTGPARTRKSLMIREDLAQRVKKAREKLGLKQEELARKLAVKESLIHNMESGKFRPNIAVARRFESFLRIKLVESVEEGQVMTGEGSKEDLTIGDLITIKRRRR
ncbi:MAG: TIGR00270 family protein [DPANN group archaeon]|nr:TIGR00270 family protein [DPANN group archaeon]